MCSCMTYPDASLMFTIREAKNCFEIELNDNFLLFPHPRRYSTEY